MGKVIDSMARSLKAVRVVDDGWRESGDGRVSTMQASGLPARIRLEVDISRLPRRQDAPDQPSEGQGLQNRLNDIATGVVEELRAEMNLNRDELQVGSVGAVPISASPMTFRHDIELNVDAVTAQRLGITANKLDDPLSARLTQLMSATNDRSRG